VSAGVEEPDGPGAVPPMLGAVRQRSWLRAQFGPWVELVAVVALAFVAAYLIQLLLVKPYQIPTGSMIPTLDEGDRVLVARFWYRVADVQRGDIVVFHPPASAEEAGASGTSTDNYIKRAIGLPGDTLGSFRGHVYVCTGVRPAARTAPLATPGCALLPEAYIHGKATGRCDAEGSPRDFGPYTVPPGHYFMMGDNRTYSSDSRCWGVIGKGQIIGRAFTTYWPPARVGWLG